MNYSERDGTGLGTVVEFHSDDRAWYGISLIHNGLPAHIYVAYQSVLPSPSIKQRSLRSAEIDRQVQQIQFSPEILSQSNPRHFPHGDQSSVE